MLDDDARRPRLRTLHGFGYPFAAEASTEAPSDDGAASEESDKKDVNRGSPAIAQRVEPGRRLLVLNSAAVGLVLIVAVVGTAIIRRPPTDPGPISFVVVPPHETTLTPSGALLAVSPNGRHLAFLAISPEARRTIWVRSLESVEAREFPGTDDALAPFWSPDSLQLAFFAQGKLKKTDLSGGPPQVIADAQGIGLGGTWNQQGTIVFGGDGMGLFSVPAGGGSRQAITRLDEAKGETAHTFPSFLPDGRHFTLLRRTGSMGSGEIYLGSLDSSTITPLVAADSQAVLWFDRSGKPLRTFGTTPRDQDPALSPDGRQIAVDRFDPATRTRNIWILDEERGIASRLTTGRWDIAPVWSPDGTRVAFASDRDGKLAIFEKSVLGGADGRLLLEAPVVAIDWSRDGRFLLYTEPIAARSDIGVLTLVDGKRAPLIKSPFNERTPRLSPDGQWLAYSSVETGRAEVYVTSFPGRENKWQVSSSGGVEPVWRSDGKELFYIAGDQKLMAAAVHPGKSSRLVGTPVPLFQTRMESSGQLGIIGRNQYVASPDGQKFLIRQIPPNAPLPPITVISSWTMMLPAEMRP